MTTLEAIAVLAAGLAAGTINGVIGSGTLITFPVLLAIGYPPVVANVTNTVGLVSGSVTAVYGYRAQLRGHWRWALGFAAFSAAGALVGSILLLTLPASAFRVIVPVLIAVALVLVVLQPRISKAILARRAEGAAPDGRALRAGIGLTGVYGGYFGAAQGVLLFALLGAALTEDLQRVNALRNLLAGTANGTAAIVFILVADVRPLAALLIAIGATAGGLLGARIGQRLSSTALRAVVVVVGLVAIVQVLR